jgi:hypothetical protein
MKEPTHQAEQQRERLLRAINQLARRALFGTISETYRTCGTPGCRCHREGPKHGPHLYVSYRGDKGKTTGYYVPKAIQAEVRQSIKAWGELQENLGAWHNSIRSGSSPRALEKSALLQQALTNLQTCRRVLAKVCKLSSRAFPKTKTALQKKA